MNIDEAKAVALGLSLSGITDTLVSAWAGKYVNDFVDRGRIKKSMPKAMSIFALSLKIWMDGM